MPPDRPTTDRQKVVADRHVVHLVRPARRGGVWPCREADRRDHRRRCRRANHQLEAVRHALQDHLVVQLCDPSTINAKRVWGAREKKGEARWAASTCAASSYVDRVLVKERVRLHKQLPRKVLQHPPERTPVPTHPSRYSRACAWSQGGLAAGVTDKVVLGKVLLGGKVVGRERQARWRAQRDPLDGMLRHARRGRRGHGHGVDPAASVGGEPWRVLGRIERVKDLPLLLTRTHAAPCTPKTTRRRSSGG